MAKYTLAQIQAAMSPVKIGPATRSRLSDLFSNIFDSAAAHRVNLHEMRKTAAYKDVLADTPGTSLLGLGDAAGTVLTGTTTNGGSTATANESAGFFFRLPKSYVAGGAVTVRLRAKVSVARAVSATCDVVAKRIDGDGAAGSDICATAAQNLTTSYADYDFTVTPTTLVPGDLLLVDVYGIANDTGGSSNGAVTIAAVTVLIAEFA